MLQVFFSDLAIVMVVFVFYNLIHRLLNRLTDSGKPYAAIAIVHWIILGILAVISLAAWAMFVVVRVRYVQGPYGDLTEFSLDVNKVDGARTILFFVVSLEIFAWILFAAIKAGSHRFTSRVSYRMDFPDLCLVYGIKRNSPHHRFLSMPSLAEASAGSR